MDLPAGKAGGDVLRELMDGVMEFSYRGCSRAVSVDLQAVSIGDGLHVCVLGVAP